MHNQASVAVEDLLVSHIRRFWRMHLYAGLSMIGLGVVIAVVILLAGRTGHRASGAGVFGAGGLAIGLPFVALALRDPRKTELVRMLRERSHSSIVWLYTVAGSHQIGSGASVVVGYQDGQRAQAMTYHGKEDELLDALASIAPHATVGWTDELEVRFRANPGSLRRKT
jgi:hypothetical protein